VFFGDAMQQVAVLLAELVHHLIVAGAQTLDQPLPAVFLFLAHDPSPEGTQRLWKVASGQAASVTRCFHQGKDNSEPAAA
jgi:hypothetical protein